jgi:anti-sigma B factor antagonist
MPDGSPFTLHAVAGSTGAVITLGGELDLTNAPALDHAVDDALARLCERPPARLILDMAGVKFLDVAAARVIATAAQAWPGPRPIVIRDPSPIVRRLLEVSGLSAELRLEGTIPSSCNGAGPALPDGQPAEAELGPRQIA